VTELQLVDDDKFEEVMEDFKGYCIRFSLRMKALEERLAAQDQRIQEMDDAIAQFMKHIRK